MREAEHSRHDTAHIDADDHKNQPVNGAPSENHTAHAPSRQDIRQGGEATVLLAHRPYGHTHTIEHHLLYYQHQDGRNQEDAVGEGPVVGIDILVPDGVHGSISLLVRESIQGQALNLNPVNLIQHHELGPHQEVLVVEEAAHIGVDTEGRRFLRCQAVAEVGRKIHDSVHLALLQEGFRFLYVGTPPGDIHFPRRIHLPDHLPAFAAGSVIDHGDGRFFKDAVLVHEIVQDRVQESGDDENDHHTAVIEDVPQFQVEDA